MGRQRVFILGLVLVGLSSSLAAHHSFAMYDMQKSQSMTGKLTRFIPGGNHAQLVFEVLGDDGKPMMKDGKVVLWGVETGSAAAIARNGITVDSFPVGTAGFQGPHGEAVPEIMYPGTVGLAAGKRGKAGESYEVQREDVDYPADRPMSGPVAAISLYCSTFQRIPG